MRCWNSPRRSAARAGLVGPTTADFPFVDLAIRRALDACGSTTACRGGFSIRAAACRAPRLGEYLRLARLLWAPSDAPVGEVIECSGPLYQRLVHPLLLAALNIEPREGSAALAAAVVRETLAHGGTACRPLIARDGLGPTLHRAGASSICVERNVEVRLDHELRALRFDGGRVAALDFGAERVDARRRRRGDPGGAAPCRGGAGAGACRCRTSHRAIANAHFRIDAAARHAADASASSTARRNGFSPSPAGCRSRSATPTA